MGGQGGRGERQPRRLPASATPRRTFRAAHAASSVAVEHLEVVVEAASGLQSRRVGEAGGGRALDGGGRRRGARRRLAAGLGPAHVAMQAVVWTQLSCAEAAQDRQGQGGQEWSGPSAEFKPAPQVRPQQRRQPPGAALRASHLQPARRGPAGGPGGPSRRPSGPGRVAQHTPGTLGTGIGGRWRSQRSREARAEQAGRPNLGAAAARRRHSAAGPCAAAGAVPGRLFPCASSLSRLSLHRFDKRATS